MASITASELGKKILEMKALEEKGFEFERQEKEALAEAERLSKLTDKARAELAVHGDNIQRLRQLQERLGKEATEERQKAEKHRQNAAEERQKAEEHRQKATEERQKAGEHKQNAAAERQKAAEHREKAAEQRAIAEDARKKQAAADQKTEEIRKKLVAGGVAKVLGTTSANVQPLIPADRSIDFVVPTGPLKISDEGMKTLIKIAKDNPNFTSGDFTYCGKARGSVPPDAVLTFISEIPNLKIEKLVIPFPLEENEINDLAKSAYAAKETFKVFLGDPSTNERYNTALAAVKASNKPIPPAKPNRVSSPNQPISTPIKNSTPVKNIPTHAPKEGSPPKA